MPKPRSAARDRTYHLWLDTGGRRPLTDIAKECGVSPGQVRKWKAVDGWSLTGKKKSDAGVTKPTAANGNCNAKENGNVKAIKPKKRGNNPRGNPAIPPAPEGNKRALTAGEYETILYASLTEEERALTAAAVGMDPVDAMRSTIALLTVRERRMLGRIQERLSMNGSASIGGSEMFAARVLNTKAENVTGAALKKQCVEYESVIGFVTTLEDALTRVQARKANALALLHRMRRDHLMVDLERRKVDALEKRTTLEQKRFDFEFEHIRGEEDDRVAGWLSATRPSDEEVRALYTIEDAPEGEDAP
ncbi:MAG: hypothetical protein GX418_04365 [Clostridiales bacterium]|nr:hypothetical protein [Clostridiales bacterium]